jgi:hypothetical protein
MTPDVFVGPVVVLFGIEMSDSTVLENVCVRHAGNHDFIVGTTPESPVLNDARAGLTYWVPYERVRMMAVYPDLSIAVKSLEESGARHFDRKWWR